MRSIMPTQRFTIGFVPTALFLLTASSGALADDTNATDDEASKESNQTKIAGVFEAVKAKEILVDTKRVESLKIKRLVEHGTHVRKGQNVVWFETKDIDKTIKAAEVELRLAKLELQDAEFEHEQFLETQELDRAAAIRARENAQQDYDNFVQVDRERQQLTAEFNLKFSQAALENAMEELEQLEQMYKEDDLTEQSEEIVLKRAKRAVESAQFRLDGTTIQSERTVAQGIPRSTAKQEDSLARAQIAYQKSVQNLESARRRRDIELAQTRDKFSDQKERLDELRQARKRVVLASPIDGVFLHGRLNRGKLGDKPSSLQIGSKVASGQVVATVVNPDKLQIRVNLDEKHLAIVTPGTKCTVTTAAFAEFETSGTVKSVSSVPYAGTRYDCVVTFQRTKRQPPLRPTMTCELTFESPANPPEQPADDSSDDQQAAKEEHQ